MRLPWISRSAHEAVASLLSAQVTELKEERKLLLDRLAILGLGEALYAKPELTTDVVTTDGPELTPDPEQEILESVLRLRHRPAKLADSLTRRIRRERDSRSTLPKVAWIPQTSEIEKQLDEAETAGRKQAFN